MKNKTVRISLGLLAAFAFAAPAGTIYAASGNIPTGTTNSIKANGGSANGGSSSGGSSGSSSSTTSDYTVSDMPKSSIIGGEGALIPDNITTADIGNRLSKKGYDIADMIRQICVPVCLIAFVCGAVAAIFGALSKKATVIPGLISMGVAIVGYVLIYNAPLIMAWGTRFLTSG